LHLHLLLLLVHQTNVATCTRAAAHGGGRTIGYEQFGVFFSIISAGGAAVCVLECHFG
jgi:hypothetical protein